MPSIRCSAACDPSEMDSLTATYDTAAPEILSYQVRKDQLQILVDNQSVVDSWLAASVPSIIPDGTSREDAIWLAYTHVVNAYAPGLCGRGGYRLQAERGPGSGLRTQERKRHLRRPYKAFPLHR